ncbi:MAG: NAD(P)/FAD-dependent oxidoreductase [Erythrobacter sp.]|nr:MAG: NAD(P)/FAD-dependent oxidoreductase [Erythrobacter sp.]
MDTNFDAIVLGGGAAGLFCAAQAGQRGRHVLVLERAEKVGKKILISGGGRCNFTNLGAGPANYLSANPHFAKSALSRYTPQDFVALVEKHHIAWHEKTLGQLFCDGSARQIVDMLLDECAAGSGKVTIRCDEEVSEVSHDGAAFRVTTRTGTFTAPALVIATGGPSIPKMGASDFAYALARQFGLKVVEPRPALVPLTLGGDEVLFRELSGVAAPVEATAGNATFREAALFTHRGLSGPAILQVSSYWRRGDPVSINFFPDKPFGWLLREKRIQPREFLRSVLADHLPTSLAHKLAEQVSKDQGIGGCMNDNTDRALGAVERQLANWRFHPNGSEGFAKAEVTAGGISTAELSSKTMEAKKVPGLFAIGEGVDVTGWLGGYNFQWAWASAHAAAQAL